MTAVIDLALDDNRLTAALVDSFYKIHKAFGPGLLETVYEDCLVQELTRRGIKFERQKAVRLFYEGQELPTRLRLDLLVEDKIVVELKSVERTLPLHEAQLLTYLKLSGYKIGFLVNFNVPLIKDGIKRLVHNF